jgi:hypothetical protein
MGAPKSNLPACSPKEPPALVDELEANTYSSLYRVRDILEPRIDTKRFADDDWLADPRNARIAALQLKYLAMQKEVALGVISNQIKLGSDHLDRARVEAKREAVIHELYEREFGPKRSADDR